MTRTAATRALAGTLVGIGGGVDMVLQVGRECPSHACAHCNSLAHPVRATIAVQRTDSGARTDRTAA